MLNIIKYHSTYHKIIINKYFKYILQNILFDDNTI